MRTITGSARSATTSSRPECASAAMRDRQTPAAMARMAAMSAAGRTTLSSIPRSHWCCSRQSIVMRNDPHGVPGSMTSPVMKSSKRSSTSRISAALVTTASRPTIVTGRTTRSTAKAALSSPGCEKIWQVARYLTICSKRRTDRRKPPIAVGLAVTSGLASDGPARTPGASCGASMLMAGFRMRMTPPAAGRAMRPRGSAPGTGGSSSSKTSLAGAPDQFDMLLEYGPWHHGKSSWPRAKSRAASGI